MSHKLTPHTLLVLTLAVAAVALAALGWPLTALLVAVHVVLMLWDRGRVECALAAIWLEIRCSEGLKENRRFYWYTAKGRRADKQIDVPAFGSIEGPFWMDRWHPLTTATFHELAAAIRKNNLWRNDR